MYYKTFHDYLFTIMPNGAKRTKNPLHKLTEKHGAEYVVNTAFRAMAPYVSGYGCTLAKLCQVLGHAFDPSLENTRGIKHGSFFVNYLHMNKLIELKQLETNTYMVKLCDEEFAELMASMAWKKRTYSITEQPRAWVKPWSKGVPIVKYLKPEDAHHYTIDQIPEVYRALNCLQDTEWQINRDILALMCEGLDNFSPHVVEDEDVAAARKELIGLKGRYNRMEQWIFEQQIEDPLVQKYAKKNAKQVSQSKFKDSAKPASLVCKEYSKMSGFVNAVELAIRVEDEPLYFQHNCDYRGRLYALCNELSPQGADNEKALLKFSSTGPVDEHWIKVHIANCAGHDKISYADREKWVNDNITAIRLIGHDPRDELSMAWLVEQGIHGEDKTKWQFLAACIEYSNYEETGEWFIPIDMDATSSGLQFLCALSKDDQLAQHVNVSPCEYAPVGDIYQKVGNDFIRTLDTEKVDFLGHLFEGSKILRKMSKRPTMVFPYSGGATAMASGLYNDKDTFGDDVLMSMSYTQCLAIGNNIYKSIKDHLPRASAIMKSMQNSFVGYTGDALVTWRGPTNFRAFQRKSQSVVFRQIVLLDRYKDRGVQVRAYRDNNKPNLQKHKSAIAPNVVHMLDSAMMVKTINALSDAGCTNFHAIHDCFGVHPGYVDLLNSKVREEFYKIVTYDWIGDIMRQATGKYDAPEKGTWNPRDVLTSKYFLC